MAEISIDRQLDGSGYILRILLDTISVKVMEEIAEQAPKAIAELYVKEHAQEIMEKVNANEVATCIAAQMAERLAKHFKLKEETKDGGTDSSGGKP